MDKKEQHDMIIVRFRHSLDDLKSVINYKKNINFDLSEYYIKWSEYDLDVLEETYKELHKLRVRQVLMNIILPFIITSYFIISEALRLINKDASTSNAYSIGFVIDYFQAILIFIILPIMVLYSILGNYLGIDSEKNDMQLNFIKNVFYGFLIAVIIIDIFGKLLT